MKWIGTVKYVIAFLLLAALVSTSGCFDIHTAKQIFYPPNNDKVDMANGTIARVMYEYQGPVDTLGLVQIGAVEFHREIDNFHIAPGGGYLYLWVQVNFIPDSMKQVSFTSYINVTLSYIPENGGSEVIVYSQYTSSPDTLVNIAKGVGNIVDPEPGLWSLMVEGVGTRVVPIATGVASYDWFLVTVGGQYSDRSYNHNSPEEGSTPS